jgi:uncharacterized protein (DUF302 family)
VPTLEQTRYGITTESELPFEAAVERITAELKEEGFGVLTTIDVQATLKQKLDLDTEPYVILGACNPSLAHQALTAEPEIGLLLPCNVIVYQRNGRTHVAVMDPAAAMGIVENDALTPVGTAARERLQRAMARL